jgi:hypothetical protein
MAKISTYPVISIPTFNDLLIGTDVANLNDTKNFSLGDIAALIISNNYVPYTGANQDVFLGAFNISANSFINTNGTVLDFLKADGSLDSTVYQPAGNYITSLTGQATASGPGAATVTLSNSAVIGKVLTGLTITGGSVSATDSILTAFGKVQNQINGLIGGVVYKGTWNASTNTPLIQSGIGTQGWYYVVNVAGSTNIDGISDWNVGDWIIFDGTAWQQVDNTDTVVSVNGQVGVVVLTTTNISEGTNLYFTDSRARLALSLTTTGNSGVSTYNNATGVFNIPDYTASGLGAVPTSRQLSINGTSYDLSADRSWSVGTVTSVGTSAPLTGGTITGSGTIGITQAGVSTDGYLSSTDWNTFNNKQNALTNPVTGTGTIYYLPMWSGASSLTDSILSYSSNIVTFNYNSASGGTINYTNTNGTAYTYTIQMNNATAPRQTYHSYTDGNIIQQINSVVVSKNLESGQLVLPLYTATSSFTGTAVGLLGFDSLGNVLTTAVPTGTNIYNADGTLTGDRILTSGGYNLTFTGSNTAASAIARGLYLTPTLIAAANSDVLAALDINPTFTLGAYTGVSSLALRVTGDIFQNTGNFVGSSTKTITNTIAGGTSTSTSILSVNNIFTSIGTPTTSYFGSYTYALLNNIGSSGSLIQNIYGTYSNAIARGVTATAPIGVFGGFFTASRNDSSDISTAANNNITGLQGNILLNTATAIATANVYCISSVGQMLGGSSTNFMQYDSNSNIGLSTSALATTITNYHVLRSRLILGTSSGNTHTITNFYAIYLTAPTVNATGTITNRWGVYAPDSAMNHYFNGTVLIGTATVGVYKLDVNGTGRFQDNLLVSKNQAAETSITVSNTTAGTTSRASFIATSVNGSMSMTKVSSTYTTVGTVIQVNDAVITNTTNGDISIYNNVGTGRIKFASNAATTPQMVLSQTGNLLVGTTTDSTYKLDLVGSQRITTTSTTLASLSLTNTSSVVNASTYGITSGTTVNVSAAASYTGNVVQTGVQGSLTLNFAGAATISNANPLAGVIAIGTTNITTGTVTVTQGSAPNTIRAVSSIYAQLQFASPSTGTLSHYANIWCASPNGVTGSLTVTNYYGILLQPAVASSGFITATNPWGVYQEGTADKNYFAGNLLIGSTTDSGQKLQVTGTSILTGALTVTGSTTAATAIARGAYYTPTLVAAANSDFLVGLDVSPTYTNGAFTGVANIGIRTSSLAITGLNNPGAIIYTIGNTILSQTSTFMYDGTNNRLGIGTATPSFQIHATGSIRGNALFALSAITVGATTAATTSSLVDIISTTSGVLLPRMTTTQKNAIATPATGLIVYDTTLNKLCVYTGAAWQTITSV